MRAVYIMKTKHDLYKVGVAGDVAKRLKSLQTSNGNAIYLISYAYTGDALMLERKIHNILQDYRHTGGREWFQLTPEQALKICVYLHQNITCYQNEKDTKELIDEYSKLHLKLLENHAALVTLSQRVGTNVNKEINRYNTTKPINTKELAQTLKSRDNVDLIDLAIKIVKEEHKASTSLLQRKLGIGYGRAARIIDELEQREIITAGSGNNARQVIVKD